MAINGTLEIRDWAIVVPISATWRFRELHPMSELHAVRKLLKCKPQSRISNSPISFPKLLGLPRFSMGCEISTIPPTDEWLYSQPTRISLRVIRNQKRLTNDTDCGFQNDEVLSPARRKVREAKRLENRDVEAWSRI
jgi:hypothetical protein